MAELIKSNLNIEEVWGSEISLSYNYEYAGTTDLVAVSAGQTKYCRLLNNLIDLK